ncbi:DNA-binding SARP family transcriptional activator [Crossiella equi]|uniref:DNA-binding SARP family transcriptional activator n=1 Tax=Crossiella equi TaxID=130796 RepID=A0ABS5AJW2_9PSEU|nr:AfsR/SARP family transcriptional regulator [Crossiella equi]MBP2476691.1 DNA-binding SARP family transcriptional activator [Crossiella equi]
MVNCENVEVRYRLLGPVGAEGSGGPARLGGPKQRTVLAALLLSPNRVVPEDQLIDLLWGQAPPASARGQLQVRVSELRKLLGRTAIVRRSPGYLIQVDPGQVDLEVFEELVRAARGAAAAGRQRQAAEGFRTALGLWHGPSLGGVTDELAAREAPMLAERRLAVLEELFEAELVLGRAAQVVGELRRAAEENPFRERLLVQLMVALHQSGRTGDALEAYAHARRRFRDELGIEPGRVVQELHVKVLAGELEPATPPEPRLRVAPEEPARVRPAELPGDVRGFAGRRAVLALLDAELAARRRSGNPGADIWVVHGTAGVGKTALAVHWAHGVREHFPDGQLYVDLHGFDAAREPLSPVAALGRILRAMGVSAAGIPAELDEQAALYRSLLADRRLLLVLDNARDADQVRPLLPPSGTVLVTSRHRLGELVADSGARSLPLPVLAAEDSRAVLTGMLGADAVAAESTAVDELGRRCGQLPLALRIAAANITARPEPRIAEFVTDLARGGALAGLVLDGAEESALTGAFAVSYRALAPESRRLFRLLGLVPSPVFPVEIAAAVLGGPVSEAARLLHRLAATHLVDQGADGRFRMHDLLREYAVEVARAEETAADRDRACARLVRYYLPFGGHPTGRVA